MENINKNRIIARFLGAEIYIKDVDGFSKPLSVFNSKDLIFDKDWNWLMEVVEKIESLGNTFLTLKSPAYLTYIQENIFEEKKYKGIANTKIESVYNACVEFIKWYNEQQI